VIVERSEGRHNLAVGNLDPLAEAYQQSMAHVHADVRTSTNLQDGFWSLPQSQGLSIRPHMAYVAPTNTEVLDTVSRGNRCNFSVLVPVCCFVEQPERILVKWTSSRVWRKVADGSLDSAAHEADAAVGQCDSAIADRERYHSFLLGHHPWCVGPSQSKGKVVKTVAQVLKGVSDDETHLIWQWLEHLGHEADAPLVIELLKNSVAAVIHPPLDQPLSLIYVELCPGELAAVTQ
jgi:hypothetical protein